MITPYAVTVVTVKMPTTLNAYRSDRYLSLLFPNQKSNDPKRGCNDERQIISWNFVAVVDSRLRVLVLPLDWTGRTTCLAYPCHPFRHPYMLRVGAIALTNTRQERVSHDVKLCSDHVL
jgi:hypothetical protein